MRTEEWHQLVLDNRDLVRKIASGLKATLPTFIMSEDLVSAGDLGLCKAAKSWDPNRSRGGQFRTYASYRIRGEILDYLREIDDAGRTTRYLAKRGLASSPATVSIHAEVSDIGNRNRRLTLIEVLAGPNGCPLQHATKKELPHLPRGLQAVERVVIEHYYKDGLTMKMIARRLSLCESRICQIHQSAIALLKSAYGMRLEQTRQPRMA